MRRLRTGLAAFYLGFTVPFAAAQSSPIANVSVLVQIPPARGALTPPLGFGVTAPTGILVRGVAGTLATFGIPNTASAPVVQYYDGTGKSISFINPAIALDFSAIFASVGAFPLTPGAGDFADVETFSPGTYSVRVEDLNQTGGTVLLELYSGAYRYAGIGSGTTPAAPGYIANFSVLLQIPPGGSAPPLGFVSSNGSGYLIRAVGPSLAAFGVPNPASAPALALINHMSGNDLFKEISIQPQPTDYNHVFASVGAFLLTPGATDFYRTIFVGPGAYSLIATDTSGKGGAVLIEVYANPDLGQTVN